ncbi:MAG TPA: MFS transporter [Nocardioidaceae bacterium]|nr:MFS transporter [Nocardioidaceae bacterium]
MTTPRTSLGHLPHLLRGQWFRRLFAVRVSSQFADGIFQVALASYVLFSPERQPTPGRIAVTLAVMLLPFSILGPFAGVFLDRWPRRQVLALVNLGRSVIVAGLAVLVANDVPELVFYVVVVGCLSLNRFILAGLSASLPHTVTNDDLVTANALTPTLGAIAALTGALLGTVISRSSDAAVLFAAAAGFAGAGLLALRIPRLLLGPDFDADRPAAREAVRHVFAGLVAGVRHLQERRTPAYALLAIASSRFWLGLATVSGFLLYRNHFYPGDADKALAALSVMLGLSALGFVMAAVVTPPVVERIAHRTWIVALLAVACVAQVFPFSTYAQPGLWVSGFFLGFAAQGVKICVDTLVQLGVDDAYRGRVFSLYDVLFNLAFVGAAAFAAAAVPDDGRSYVVVGVMALGYAVTAAFYARVTREVHV